MTTWKEVTELVRARIISLMKNRKHGENWLADLELCSDGKRLGVCIAIDVCSGAIEPEVFAEIIESIDAGWTDARKEFGKIVNEIRCKELICSSKFYDSSNDGVSYVRVIELGDFIQYYMHPKYTRAPHHVKRIRSMYFDTENGVELSGVRRWFSGRLPNVWVMPFDDLLTLIGSAKRDERGSVVYDALGLSLKNGVSGRNRPELVAVRYPEKFSVGCAQPTTMDAWWVDSGGYYLSFGKEDSWGRTHSLTGAFASQRERVHSHFKNLTSGYRTHYIGIVSKKAAGTESRVLDDGYARLEEILR